MFNIIQIENNLDYSDEFLHTLHDVLLPCNYTEMIHQVYYYFFFKFWSVLAIEQIYLFF